MGSLIQHILRDNQWQSPNHSCHIDNNSFLEVMLEVWYLDCHFLYDTTLAYCLKITDTVWSSVGKKVCNTNEKFLIFPHFFFFICCFKFSVFSIFPQLFIARHWVKKILKSWLLLYLLHDMGFCTWRVALLLCAGMAIPCLHVPDRMLSFSFNNVAIGNNFVLLTGNISHICIRWIVLITLQSNWHCLLWKLSYMLFLWKHTHAHVHATRM